MTKYVIEIIRTHTATFEADDERDVIKQAFHYNLDARKCKCYHTALGRIKEVK